MYDPETGGGFHGWPNARQMVQEYWDLAVQALIAWDFVRGAFHLGAAAHLVQDLCVPHHAAARIFSGHSHLLRFRLAPELMEQAVADLLPRAQRSTAGFVRFTLQRAGLARTARYRKCSGGALDFCGGDAEEPAGTPVQRAGAADSDPGGLMRNRFFISVAANLNQGHPTRLTESRYC